MGSGLLCCLCHKTGHDKGGPVNTCSAKGRGTHLQRKQLSSVHDGYRLIPRNKLLIAGVFLPVTNVTLDQILLKTLEWNAGQWAAGSCWFGLFFLTERSQGDICPLLHSTAPWNQSGPWRNQDWVESQSPTLTICMSSHTTCFLWPSVHAPSKGINSQHTKLLGG